MKHSKITVGTVALLTAASVLAGCTTDTAPPQTPDATGVTTTTEPGALAPTSNAAGSAAPTDAATTPAPIEVKAGDKLTKKDLDNLPEGVAGYKLPDGKVVAVESDKPLPKSVVKDAESRSMASKSMPQGQREVNSQLQWELSQETGKEIILIARMSGVTRDGSRAGLILNIYGVRELRATPASGWTVQSASKAAREWIAAQDTPEIYELVIQP